MRGQEDYRKNNPVQRNLGNFNNNTHSTHSLINAKEYHKPLLPRQRENQRNLKDHSSSKYQKNYEDHETVKGIKQHSSKQIKDTSSTKSQTLVKKPQYIPHLRLPSDNQGISINVNIQNLITPKQLLNMHNYGVLKQLKEQKRSVQKQNINNQQLKKPRKASNLKSDLDSFEFQCTEELTCTITRKPSPTLNRQQKQVRGGFRQKDKSVHQKIMNSQQIIKKYEREIEELNSNFSAQSLIFLDSRQQIYRVNSNYIQVWQQNFTWKMRAQVVEWMMQVSYQYELKRQTFHISINLVDRYLQKQKNLPKSDFQLVGAAAMFIASKLQQFEPKCSQQFVKATGFAITSSKLKEMQKKICHSLQYHLNPPTSYRWANRLMVQWDAYLKANQQAQMHPAYSTISQIYFKQCDEQSYINFRVLMQLIDCSTLDIQTVQYNPKLLVCAFMYLYVGKQAKYFSTRDIIHKFPGSSLYLLDEKNIYTDFFDKFLQFTFDLQILDLLPTIQYCATYFLLPPNVEMPASKFNPEAYQDMELQQYCSIQTYDKNMYPIINKRARETHI